MNTTDAAPSEPRPHPSLIRRLMSIVYDMFLVVALLFVVTTAMFILNHAHAIEHGSPFYWPLRLSLVLTMFIYFGWFWTHGGQTLGMKTWKIKLCSRGGKPVSWKQALIYFLAAALSWAVVGMGFLWSLFNQDRATWHDLIAGCEMLDVR